MKNNLSGLKLLPEDEIFRLFAEFGRDKRQVKINGAIGVYLDEKGKTFVHPSIKQAVEFLDLSNFNYLPISGDPVFLDESLKLLLGADLLEEYGDNFARQGVIGGTDGLYIWGRLIKKINKNPKIIIGQPTWENHKKIFNFLGFNIIEYQHLDNKSSLNLESLESAIVQNPGVYILLHGGSTHNPTGVNPKRQEWIRLLEIIKDRQIEVLFDHAYLGMGDSINEDNWPVRLFIERNVPCSVIISFSKNMTLYQHRVGVLLVGTKSKREKEIIESHLQYIFRIVNSNPAAFGETLVKTVLQSRELTSLWKNHLTKMVKSLKERRALFSKYAGEKYNSVKSQRGLFSLLMLKPSEIALLKDQHAIYLLSNSRLNFGGLSLTDIPRVAKTIGDLR